MHEISEKKEGELSETPTVSAEGDEEDCMVLQKHTMTILEKMEDMYQSRTLSKSVRNIIAGTDAGPINLQAQIDSSDMNLSTLMDKK